MLRYLAERPETSPALAVEDPNVSHDEFANAAGRRFAAPRCPSRPGLSCEVCPDPVVQLVESVPQT